MRVPPVPSFWGPARKASRSGSGEQYTDGSPAPLNQTCKYTADDLSRIASVDCGNSTWAQTFSYDAFGNIQKSGTSNYIAAYSPVTNQVSGGPGYDANGNQLQLTSSIPWTSLTWNALNQPISVSSTTATYDALGRMVEKGSGGTYTQFVFRPSGAMLAVYSGGLVKGTIPLPGGGTAIYNGSGLSYIHHTDWLGSSRLATTWAHAVYSKEAYAPFGETYNEIGTPDRSFTGQDQNVATGSGGTGVYDYLFRKYDPSAGRWLSPDPYGWNAVNQGHPQSLNRYAYVENNPLNFVDSLGLCEITGTMTISWYDGSGGLISSETSNVDFGDDGNGPCSSVDFSGGVFPSGVGDGSGVDGGGGSGGPNNGCPAGPANVYNFIQANQAAANTLAQQSGVSADYLLGLSGWESQWGANRFAAQGNNFFSLHGGSSAPFANGSMQASRPPYVSLSTFPSYFASGQSLLAQYGDGLASASGPAAFAQQLIDNGFNSGNAATGGNSNFISNTVTGIAMVVRRKGC